MTNNEQHSRNLYNTLKFAYVSYVYLSSRYTIIDMVAYKHARMMQLGYIPIYELLFSIKHPEGGIFPIISLNLIVVIKKK
ncbi:hypothetical protein DSM00_184 [Leeuwenhoekiella aequorea]|uniref:Uncharacterized protein n=1 Tax=Leeuwenhoekiella aequorea TaxID=283736 RepID=A0A4Q0PDC4_9FLAO|nr:hypothetical protein DSM00_184 [Leeuwenhoekiella aequorea]